MGSAKLVEGGEEGFGEDELVKADFSTAACGSAVSTSCIALTGTGTPSSSAVWLTLRRVMGAEKSGRNVCRDTPVRAIFCETQATDRSNQTSNTRMKNER